MKKNIDCSVYVLRKSKKNTHFLTIFIFTAVKCAIICTVIAYVICIYHQQICTLPCPLITTVTGVKTVPKLLKTAEEFSSDDYRRTYRKFGNYQTAMDDFHSLKPSNIHTVKMGNGVGFNT